MIAVPEMQALKRDDCIREDRIFAAVNGRIVSRSSMEDSVCAVGESLWARP